MSVRSILPCVALILVVITLSGGAHAPRASHRSAPTFYLVIDAETCETDTIKIAGASNLPPGSILALEVGEPYQDAWKQYSDVAYVSLPNTGFFEEYIHPLSGERFHRNLDVEAYFQTTYYKNEVMQPASVLKIVGEKGWNLAGVENPSLHFEELSGLTHNPQLFQISGWYYGLDALARVPNCGER